MILVLPTTERVAEQLRLKGASVTFLQVAIGLLKKLDNDLKVTEPTWKREIKFIKDCLRAGYAQTNVPCALTSKNFSKEFEAASEGKQGNGSPVNGSHHGRVTGLSPNTRKSLVRSYTCATTGTQINDEDSDEHAAQEDIDSFQSWSESTQDDFSIDPKASLQSSVVLIPEKKGSVLDKKTSVQSIVQAADKKSLQSSVQSKGSQPRKTDAKAADRNSTTSLKSFKSSKGGREELRYTSRTGESVNGKEKKRKDHIYRGAVYASSASSQSEVDAAKLQEIFANGCPWMGPKVPSWPIEDCNDVSVSDIRAQLDDQFHSWFFDIFKLTRSSNGRPLIFVGWEALLRCGCFSNFNMNPKKGCAFLQAAESRYCADSETAYHNNIHAADVAQTTWAMLQDLKFSIYLDPMDTTGLLISAVVHDMGHDGRNNAYHTKTRDKLAIRYNDRSVLENYHVSCAFELLMNMEATNIFGSLSSQQLNLFRAEIIDMVLGTDMGQHFSKLTDFNACCSRNGTDLSKWQGDEPSMYALRGMLLHSADISNPSKPMGVAQVWAVRLLRETFTQGDLEMQLGIPVSPLCDRRTTNVAESQIGFIQFIVQPSYESLIMINTEASKVLEELSRNVQAWEMRRGQDLDLDKLAAMSGVQPSTFRRSVSMESCESTYSI